MSPLDVYVDLMEVPLDTPPPDVGDGGQIVGFPKSKSRRRTLTAAQAAPAVQHSMIIPFTRTIRLGTGGQDVKGVKRALWRANELKLTPFTPVFGPVAAKQAKVFQHQHGLPADGVIGPETIRKLGPFFDQFAFLLYEGYPPGLSPAQGKRQRALAYLFWGYNNRASIYYLQSRPMSLLNDLEHLPISEDCSTFYTKMAKYAGWADPNNLGYDGAGNTTSLSAHGRAVAVSALRSADAVFYSNPAHVGGYVGNGRIISLGSSAGPSLTDIHYRPDFATTRSYL